jgi:carbonic anhydrase/acetyltransferase-like protein (isoleucine patch superfamily)
LAHHAFDQLSEAFKSIAMQLVQFGDRWTGQHPREALFRLPRLLKVHDKRPTIADNAFIAPSALLTGDVRVGRKNYIGYQAILKAEDGQTIHLGESCNVQEKAILTGNCTVGKWATIEPMAVVESADIASGSFVGASAVVMRGAKIESGAMLCAASVLQSEATIPSGEIWSGNPAERIGRLSDEEKESMIRAAKHMVLLGIRHRDSWELTWEELENQRLAREIWGKTTQHWVHSRNKVAYVREPPSPKNNMPRRKSPYASLMGSDDTPSMHEATMPEFGFRSTSSFAVNDQ